MMMQRKLSGALCLASAVLAAALIAINLSPTPNVAAAEDGPVTLAGKVQIANSPVAGSSVTLYGAGEGESVELAQGKANNDGGFTLEIGPEKLKTAKDQVLYLVARGGAPKAGKGSPAAIALMSVLGTSLPKSVTVNELTTVASAFTAARFIDGESISGKPLGLRIAAGNTPNLVDPATGGWGKVLLDPLNSTQTTALANLNTLGSLIAASLTVADDDWRARFFKAATPIGGATPKNTLEAMAGIARRPWANRRNSMRCSTKPTRNRKTAARRTAPFVPYLVWTPPDFALSLCFAGGGTTPPAGSCSMRKAIFGAAKTGCLARSPASSRVSAAASSSSAPNGKALSPPITGFTGMGIDGVGWGTAVTRDNVWASSFNGKFLVMDFEGRPVARESDIPFKEKLLGLMGIGVAANGDVWIADGRGNQLLHFPGGRVKDGRIVKVAGLKSPFDIVIDPQNRVWVSNSQSDTVVRFPVDDPSKTETFRAGISVRALALDSKGNVWVASNTSLDFPMPKIPDGASIMKQFRNHGGSHADDTRNPPA